jgi:hypothetical protein
MIASTPLNSNRSSVDQAPRSPTASTNDAPPSGSAQSPQSFYGAFQAIRHTFLRTPPLTLFQDKPNNDHFYDLFGNLLLREGLQLNMAFDRDVAGGKCQPGCTDKSGAPQHERDHSPKRVTRYVPRILRLTINISLHSDNGLYADCALSVAGKNIHPPELSHASSSLLYTILVTFTIVTPTFCM